MTYTFNKFPAELRNHQILVAEDDESEWEAIGNAFKYFGMRNVFRAQSGAHAFRLLMEGREKGGGCPVDMVIADLHSPGMSSLELTRMIREKGFLRELPILVIEEDITVEAIQKLSGFGVSAVLLKPVAPSEIAEKVCEILADAGPRKQDRLAG